MLVCLWLHLGNPTYFLIVIADCLSVRPVLIIFFSRIQNFILNDPPSSHLPDTLKVIKYMHFTNREYFPMSKVLHLEIIFAVINKIPSHSFGAYNWVSWIHIRIFFYPSLLSWPGTILNFTLYFCQLLYIFKQERYINWSKQCALFDFLKDPLIFEAESCMVFLEFSNLWISALIN